MLNAQYSLNYNTCCFVSLMVNILFVGIFTGCSAGATRHRIAIQPPVPNQPTVELFIAKSTLLNLSLHVSYYLDFAIIKPQ